MVQSNVLNSIVHESVAAGGSTNDMAALSWIETFIRRNMNDHTRGGVMCCKTNTFPPKVMSNGWILVCEFIVS